MRILLKSVIALTIFFSVHISFAEGTWTYYLDGNTINNIIIIDDKIYCATDAGLVIWNRHDGSYTQHMYFAETGCCQYQRTELISVAATQAGHAWCTNGSELLFFDGETITCCQNSPGGQLNALLVDSNDVVWVMTSNGASRFDGNEWINYVEDGSGYELTSMLGIDEENVLWFGTDSGVSSYDGTSWVSFTNENGLPDTRVKAMAVGKDNTIWFVFRNRNLVKYDGISWTIFEEIERTPTSLAVDSFGTIWCGTAVGLYKYDGVHWNHYHYDNSELPWNTIKSVAVDDDDVVWLATDDNSRIIPDTMSVDHPNIYRGLKRFEGTHCENWMIDGPIDYHIRCIAVDLNNVKWFGTPYGGLTSFDGVRWHNFTMADTTRPHHYCQQVKRLIVLQDYSDSMLSFHRRRRAVRCRLYTKHARLVWQRLRLILSFDTGSNRSRQSTCVACMSHRDDSK